MATYEKDCACGQTHTGEQHEVDALCDYHEENKVKVDINNTKDNEENENVNTN